MNIIENALALAYRGHSGQFRKDNNLPYICHPVDVANLLNKWDIRDENMIAAAFLHDTLEDTSITKEEIKNSTNETVAYYVSELTHDPSITKQQYLDSFIDKPIEIFIIKMADRIANVRDFQISSHDYADKYAMKAEKLFRAFYDSREDEILSKYGIYTCAKIENAIPSCVVINLMEIR